MFNDRPVQRGFPNRARIHQALRLIHTADLELPGTFWERWGGYDPADATLSVQKLVRKVARLYGLEVRTIVVTFMTMPDPGRVELHDGNDFFVEINADLKDQPRTIAAVLGHEVAHIFLHRRGLGYEDTLENEVLTDVTAALFGFGALMLDNFVQTETRHTLPDGRVQITRHERCMGYLTPDELGWLLAKAEFDVGGQLESGAARRVGKQGRDMARAERETPPFSSPLWRRWWYLVQRWWAETRELDQAFDAVESYAFGGGRVTFRCPRCAQKMRLPLRKEVTATCPCCGAKWSCST